LGVRLIIFDLDGTLLDTRERDYQTFAYVFKKYGIKKLSRKKFFSLRRKGLIASEIISYFLRYGNDSLRNEILKKRKAIIEFDHFLKFDKPLFNLEKTLEKIRNKGIKIGIASLRVSNEGFIKSIEQIGILEYVDVYLCRAHIPSPIFVNDDEQELIKMKEKLYCLIIQFSKISRDETIVVGDSKIDLKAAENQKIKAFGVLTPYNREILHSFCGVKIISNIPDILEILKII